MTKQPELFFDDPDSKTKQPTFQAVFARAERTQPFDTELFGGYSSLRALTYTSSIPMIMRLLKTYDYDDFECIFGHAGMLSRDAAEVMAFQTVVNEKLHEGFVAIEGLSSERRRLIYDRAAEGTARFHVVKDTIAHAKIYLLENPDRNRVIVGSANLSETAFSGRQAETLMVFDNDQLAWQHYNDQYNSVLQSATSSLPIQTKTANILNNTPDIQDNPIIKEAISTPAGVTMYVPDTPPGEKEYTLPSVIRQTENIKPLYAKALADVKPDRSGNIKITPQTAGHMVKISLARRELEDEAPQTWLAHSNGAFTLSGNQFNLDTEPEQVTKDVEAILQFFNNYDNGFIGDVPRLQQDYFTFMCWFYASPLICDLRNNALRHNVFSFDQPVFAVLHGSSSCGKSTLIETLMESMFGYHHKIETASFTRSKLRAIQQAYRRFPVFFDDVTRDRFNRHAPEIIKDESIPYPEYPCFALSMNAEVRNFPAEIVKRCLMIYTRTSLPGDDTAARRNLQRSVATIRDQLTTSLYRAYLSRLQDVVANLTQQDHDTLDVLDLSSNILHDLIKEHLPADQAPPPWSKPMTLEQYQNRAFERPKLVLENLLHRDKHTKERRPPVGCWTLSGNHIIIAVEPITSRQTKADIPDWIVDDTATVSDQIVLNHKVLENFLGHQVRSPRRWWPFSH